MPLADMICKWNFLNLSPIAIGCNFVLWETACYAKCSSIYHSASRSRSTMVCRPMTP